MLGLPLSGVRWGIETASMYFGGMTDIYIGMLD
jgi:hypothetical protein